MMESKKKNQWTQIKKNLSKKAKRCKQKRILIKQSRQLQHTDKKKIALSFYSQIMPAKKPGALKVNAENNKQLRATQRYVC